jgi:hypothetical protein
MPNDQHSAWAQRLQRFNARPLWVRLVLAAVALVLWMVVVGLLVVLVVPLGGIMAGMAWMAALSLFAVGLASSRWVGKQLMGRVCRSDDGAEQRAQRVHTATVALLAAGVVMSVVLLLLPSRAPSRTPLATHERELAASNRPVDGKLCLLIPTVLEEGGKLAFNTVTSLTGHGTRPSRKGPRCRELVLVGPGFLLPLLLALVLVAGLRSRQRQLALEETARDDEARRQAFLRRQSSLRRETAAEGATSHAAEKPLAQRAPSIATPAAVTATTASRSNTSRAAVRAARTRTTIADVPGRVAGVFGRAPVLATSVSVYLLGALLSKLGSNAPHELARQLSPSWLTHSFHDWSVLGIWVSLAAGLLFGLLVAYLRNR